MPPPQAYVEPINWHRTAVHELSHWSGAAQRLARDLSGPFGTKAYAREELVAELCTAYVCAALGIMPSVRHADYIGSWLDVLREDNRAIVGAANAASKAADFLLAFGEQVAAAQEHGDGATSLRRSTRQRRSWVRRPLLGGFLLIKPSDKPWPNRPGWGRDWAAPSARRCGGRAVPVQTKRPMGGKLS